MKKTIIIVTTILSMYLNLIASCTETIGYDIALKKAIKEYPIMKNSPNYEYKMMNTAYGYAYMIYFNKIHDATNADMVLVTINNNCEILHVTAPTESTFYLKSKKECISKGTINGDNHSLEVKACGNNIQFEASNDALSRSFTKNEIKKIKEIFSTAQKKYSKFRDRQVLYETKGLKIWVRLYSSSKWFLVFDFTSIAPYPASPEASVWIDNSKFNEFIDLLNK